ncbi:MAG: hypothetical protein JNM42_15710 [Propionivibrio sp.]|uniref:hypothetical protein n=1 Tax=Propionivibrio sp. TaxID=2212460 RepID=UPI001A5CBACA|nr:hypothetical protein [Propionivibrio sp.]MBL8415880.1 hypothetical protein [Propionivibrio sp.]
MDLRANGFCFLCFVLLARSIGKLTGLVSDQMRRYFLAAGAAGEFGFGVGRQRSLVDDTLCRNCPG